MTTGNSWMQGAFQRGKAVVDFDQVNPNFQRVTRALGVLPTFDGIPQHHLHVVRVEWAEEAQ